MQLPSQREPQVEPSESCWTILQDHGPNDGGWGPASVQWPGIATVGPIVYTGSDPLSIEAFKEMARGLAQKTGKPTRVVRFTQREDVFVVGGPS